MTTKAFELTANQINQINLMEVCGFDLLAQVESLLRHVREYQREVRHLHRVKQNSSHAPVRRQVHQLRQVCASLQRTLEMIRDVEQPTTSQEPCRLTQESM
jgi:hypothetical protein